MLLINLLYCSLLSSTVWAAHQRTYDLLIERLHKVMVNEHYIDLGTLRATRINRTHTVVNGDIRIKVPIDDSVLVTVLFYKKSGTEYKRSAAVSYMDKPICSFYNSDALGLRDFKAATNFPDTCPLAPGTYEVKNYELDADNFPAHIPESQWRMDVLISQDEVQWCHVQTFAKILQNSIMG